jgi:hypothetical protein
MNGCYLYRGREIKENKKHTLKGQLLVLAPHEGLVSSETWLAVRKRLMNNYTYGGQRKAKNTWLSGKIKCGRCGMGLANNGHAQAISYFRCKRRMDTMSCEGCGTLRVREVEESIYTEMLKKMSEFQTLTGGNPSKANPKLTAKNIELAQVETEKTVFISFSH